MGTMGNLVAYGIDESKKIAGAVASTLNTGSKMIKGNFLSVFELLGPFNVLKTVNLELFKKEISDYSAEERLQVQQAFAMKLDLQDKAVQQKIVEATDSLNEAVDIVLEGISVFDKAKGVVLRFKTILGV
jgi:hypothetical protein